MKILLRDRLGLFLIFFMPILLVIVITSVQNSTFELVNNNKISLLVYNKDQGPLGAALSGGYPQNRFIPTTGIRYHSKES